MWKLTSGLLQFAQIISSKKKETEVQRCKNPLENFHIVLSIQSTSKEFNDVTIY